MKTAKFLIGIFALTAIVLAIFYPDEIIHGRTSFMFAHDPEMAIENTYRLVSFFVQGGIQLYNRFDGMNDAYSHLCFGLYTLSNIVVAALYVLFAPFADCSAQFFYKFFSTSFLLVNALIRLLGMFLLLRKFISNRWVLGVSLIYLNTICATPFMNETLLTNTLYSFWPLAAYCIVCFFERFEFNYALKVLAVLTLCISNSALMALGYFYQTIHFLFVGCLTVVACQFKQATVKQGLSGIRGWFTPKKIIRGLMTVVVCLGLIAPSLIWYSRLQKDFYVANSGLQKTEGRIKNARGAEGYFNYKQRSYAYPKDFLLRAFNYKQNRLGESWAFLGVGIFFLTWLGLILSTSVWRWALAIAVGLLVMVNQPSQATSIWSLPHWLNVLTNPFSYLLRSFHMASLLLPMMVLPLAALGLERCLAWIKQPQDIPVIRKWLAFGVISTWGIILYLVLPVEIKNYAAAGSGIVLAFMGVVACGHSSVRPWLAGLFLLLLPVMDSWALNQYVHPVDRYSLRAIEPRVYQGLVAQYPVVVEYQNPRMYPFRYYNGAQQRQIDPPIYNYQNSEGSYYRYNPLLERYARPNDLYEPRAEVYKNLPDDRAAQEYLRQHRRVVYTTSAPLDLAITDFDLALDTAVCHPRAAFKECRMALPKAYPSYMATSVFTDDFWLTRLIVDGNFLRPAQGYIHEAGMFDVGNIKEGYLVFSLPLEMKPKEMRLSVYLPKDIKEIWKNTDDTLGLTLSVAQDGWLIAHYPFDPKWELWVDGKKTPLSLTNGYFLGAPMTAGEHKVLLRYWPGSPLRIWIACSMLLTVGIFIMLVSFGLKKEALD